MLTIKPSVAAVGRQSGAYLGAGRLESRLSGRSRNSSSSSSSSLKYFTPPLVFLQEATEQQDWVPGRQGWDPREPTVLQASEFKRC